jgi:CDP-diacylglycerol--glycerol-3-phosphate 3-phosphatidyltransferase
VREIGITVFRFVMLRDRVIPASRGGKLKTIAQSVAISLALLPLWLVFGEWVHWLNTATMTIMLILTVVSGVDYLVSAWRLRKHVND